MDRFDSETEISCLNEQPQIVKNNVERESQQSEKHQSKPYDSLKLGKEGTRTVGENQIEIELHGEAV